VTPILAADLRARTKHLGLSLGDRARRSAGRPSVNRSSLPRRLANLI
jgi:PIN domain nuclease of toxin-antitoxin system